MDPARTKANEARQKLNDLQDEQRKLQAKLDGSYGEGDAFVALVDRCFEVKVGAHIWCLLTVLLAVQLDLAFLMLNFAMQASYCHFARCTAKYSAHLSVLQSMQCHSQVEKYTYEVCPFNRASQKEGGSATSLGTWSGFEEGETKLAFKNGATCWQGPSRSMTVRSGWARVVQRVFFKHRSGPWCLRCILADAFKQSLLHLLSWSSTLQVSLLCGQTERLAKVAEPSRCEYTAELQTPAACTPAAAEALRREVAARQRFLDGADEVEGDKRDEL